MKTHELSKYDFEVLDYVLANVKSPNPVAAARIEMLKDLFAKAHTGWLEIEDDLG